MNYKFKNLSNAKNHLSNMKIYDVFAEENDTINWSTKVGNQIKLTRRSDDQWISCDPIGGMVQRYTLSEAAQKIMSESVSISREIIQGASTEETKITEIQEEKTKEQKTVNPMEHKEIKKLALSLNKIREELVTAENRNHFIFERHIEAFKDEITVYAPGLKILFRQEFDKEWEMKNFMYYMDEYLEGFIFDCSRNS